ncbi:hypothetical protein AMAG_18052 [Allomyces macrogynus ATCC 38327]|uniref:Uncharacterized protein n=1 Tax=Allomyces macrogynus (strain ATCC 38327) TaxID=578462 RepID=A0A0L0S4U5_ALLM3|nr:hypothetical protein AMAG_18052 [Allomyces macrogynus ATCC 38327]|eukprot:KNE57451.1 hypothetical protein AMAG_18052 [Allomyces macrogynus ATCC 38327]
MTNHDIEYWKQKLLGMTFMQGVSAQAKNENEVTEADLPPLHRFLTNNSITTMDLNTGRLNVHQDNDNKITHVMFY